MLICEMTTGPQETTQILNVDTSIIVLINCAVGRQCCIIKSGLQVSLQTLESSLQAKFRLQYFFDCAFDVARQTIVSGDTDSWPVASDIPQQVVFTGK